MKARRDPDLLIKAFLDDADDVEAFVIRESYPLEADEWAQERESGLRV